MQNTCVVQYVEDPRDELISLDKGEELVYVFLASLGEEHNIKIALAGEGARVTLLGYMIGKCGAPKITITVTHQAPRTLSKIHVASVVDGEARGVVHGLINVDEEAVQASAYFAHRTLLLSSRARMNTIPSLEIRTNDVRVSHAATVSAPNLKDLFYIGSRGVPFDASRNVVIRGFIEKHCAYIPDQVLRSKVITKLTRQFI